MIYTVERKDKWKEILDSIGNYDFYHTYDYHFISKKKDESPILMVYEDELVIIAIPFLKRAIQSTSHFDLTSVYGYSGPVSKSMGNSFNNERFTHHFAKALREMNIVSVFSRLHPYIQNQENILKNLGIIEILGKVVNIDLTKDLATQRSQYGKSTKNRTNKCRKMCTIRKAISKEDISTFIDIYYENMDRLAANKNYYFSKEYFYEFLKCEDFETDVLLVIHNETNEAIAGSMFVKTKDFVQFHLSGSRTDYLYLAPANAFIDEMRIRATQENYKIFNLGGGLGSKVDSLFNFKSSFSKDFRDFKVWKYIVNHEAYENLTHLNKNFNSNSTDHNEHKKDDFFPLYRLK